MVVHAICRANVKALLSEVSSLTSLSTPSEAPVTVSAGHDTGGGIATVVLAEVGLDGEGTPS